jgi:DNA-binding GntR family transcriptional regulator
MNPEIIAQLIAQAIREGVFAPGAALVQEDLASRFEVSRSPVREALRILAAEGVVDMPPGGGATVKRRSAEELAELYDLRIAIEPTIAGFITGSISTKTIGELREIVERMDAAVGVRDWLSANYEFHVKLFGAADRPRTAEILTSLLAAAQPYSQENVAQLGGAPSAQVQHREMIAALEERDADRLAELFVAHLMDARDRLVAARVSGSVPDALSALRTPRVRAQ